MSGPSRACPALYILTICCVTAPFSGLEENECFAGAGIAVFPAKGFVFLAGPCMPRPRGFPRLLRPYQGQNMLRELMC
jgi:hypothetical protein